MTGDGNWLTGFGALFAVAALWVLAVAPQNPPQPLPRAIPAVHGQFSGKLVLVLLQDKLHPSMRAGRSLWGVERSITYQTATGDTITVPAGMVTDLASIPAPISALLPPDGPWAQAAVVHDLCYSNRGSGVWHGRHGFSRPAPYTRAECDGLLLEAMHTLGLEGWRIDLIYAGVRLGGAAGWGT